MLYLKRLLLSCCFLLAPLSLSAQQQDIVETAVAAGDFTTLATALTEAELIETLQGEGPFTVFAPNDDAFAEIDMSDLAALLEDTDELTKVLTFHVVPGRFTAADLVAREDMSLETVSGIDAIYSVDDGMVMIEGATVVQADIEASNGIIHVIDTVLMPPMDIVDTAVEAGTFTTLATALGEAELIETLQGDGPFTVFAPSDEAFEKIPEENLRALFDDEELLTRLLTYHVVAGRLMAMDIVDQGSGTLDTLSGDSLDFSVSEQGMVMVGDAMVTQTDIRSSNGVIHVIDTVLMPPDLFMDIVDTAISAGDFTTLATALTEAELIDTLKGEGPFTVFAPSDSAFAKIPDMDLQALLANPSQLSSVLTYHVVPGRFSRIDLAGRRSGSLNTVNGEPLDFAVSPSGRVMVDDAMVVQSDIIASNGIIHVIDTVLMPSAMSAEQDIVATAIAAGNFDTLATALTTAGLVETLQGEGPFTVFAPNDEAFAMLGDLQPLLDDVPALTNLLTFHVVPGAITAEELIANGAGTLPTVEGRMLSYEVVDGMVKIGGATVIQANIAASNGIIHVVDRVLMPGRECKATFDPETLQLTIPCVAIAGEEMGIVYEAVLELNDEGAFSIESVTAAP